MPKVSICIPTYNRPELLKSAVESCLAQTFQDLEILIGDDSRDTRSEQMLRTFSPHRPIRYIRNVPSLGQAQNVNRLFDLARGEFLVLLHDDDFLTPIALETLLKPLEEFNVVASFGKQYVVTNEGVVLEAESESTNDHYFRNDRTADKIQCPVWSALVQQFPNNGWMARTAAVRATRYLDDPEVGQACDAEFADRLANRGKFFFAGKYTSAYR